MAVDRDTLARYVHRGISQLARGAAWSTASRSDGSDTLAQGDYTDAIDSALRELGYVDVDGVPDESLVDALDFESLAESVTMKSLERLQAYYATVVDTVGGPIRIYRSQIAKALGTAVSSSTGRRLVTGGLGVITVTTLLEDDL